MIEENTLSESTSLPNPLRKKKLTKKMQRELFQEEQDFYLKERAFEVIKDHFKGKNHSIIYQGPGYYVVASPQTLSINEPVDERVRLFHGPERTIQKKVCLLHLVRFTEESPTKEIQSWIDLDCEKYYISRLGEYKEDK